MDNFWPVSVITVLCSLFVIYKYFTLRHDYDELKSKHLASLRENGRLKAKLKTEEEASKQKLIEFRARIIGLVRRRDPELSTKVEEILAKLL